METIIEKDSLRIPLLILTAVFFVILGGGMGLAYMGGVFTGKEAVTANDLRITNQARLHPGPPLAPGAAKR